MEMYRKNSIIVLCTIVILDYLYFRQHHVRSPSKSKGYLSVKIILYMKGDLIFGADNISLTHI